jgi:hypothetical protein
LSHIVHGFANLLPFTISLFATTTQFVMGLWSYGEKISKPNAPSAFDGDWQWEMELSSFLVWRWAPSIGNLHRLLSNAGGL